MNKTENKTEVIVVGAGPAGIACAITLAKAGKEVVLIERGLFAGSKNVFGGAIYTQAVKEIFPDFDGCGESGHPVCIQIFGICVESAAGSVSDNRFIDCFANRYFLFYISGTFLCHRCI